MFPVVLSWIANPKNLALVILGVCLIVVTGYAGVKYVQVASKEKTIVAQAADLKLKAAEIQTQKDQIATMTINLKNIQAARDSMQRIQAANKVLRSQIAQLSGVKDDGTEAQVYRGMFNFFTAGGVRGNDVPAVQAGPGLLPPANPADAGRKQPPEPGGGGQ